MGYTVVKPKGITSTIPKPPLPRIIKEGTIGDCPYCGSTTIKRWIWLGKSIGCIQETCTNYYKRLR